MIEENVKMIEDAPLDMEQRVELLLIYAGKKPATDIFVRSHEYNPKTDCFELDGEKVKELENLLKILGLPYVIDKLEVFEQGKVIYTDGTTKPLPSVERVPVYVAKNKETLDRFLKASESLDQREIGRCYGFPETAIDAFMGKRKRLESNVYPHSPMDYFSQFVHSVDCVYDEEKISMEWARTVKDLSQKLWKEIGEYCKIPYVTEL